MLNRIICVPSREADATLVEVPSADGDLALMLACGAEIAGYAVKQVRHLPTSDIIALELSPGIVSGQVGDLVRAGYEQVAAPCGQLIAEECFHIAS